jgi:hypothetical protein
LIYQDEKTEENRHSRIDIMRKHLHSGVEERYLGRLKRAHTVEMLYGTLAKFGETFALDAWQYRAKPTKVVGRCRD